MDTHGIRKVSSGKVDRVSEGEGGRREWGGNCIFLQNMYFLAVNVDYRYYVNLIMWTTPASR